MVIRELEAEGAGSPRLEPIRRCAEASAAAFLAADLPELGRQMIANTEAQRALHPDLIGPGHQRVIDIARRYRACGWKVNGAGGAGGSVTLLSGPDHSLRREMVQAVLAADPAFRSIPIALAPRGLRVWESAP
jgi:D-glycero-alpha-D-manno-heptose-7-phosphate kinase